MSKKLSTDQLHELMECLQFVEDPRVQGRSKHLLIDILVLSVCAVLCGAEGVLEIEVFGEEKEDWLKQFLKLPNGIPSHDTIARVLSLVDPVQTEIAFGEWVQGIVASRKIPSISLDGKSSKGTERGFNHATRPLQVVTAYAHELGLSLSQSESKSSGLAEAEAAMDCLKMLDIKGVTVMADAGLAVKKVIHQIRKQKGHYLVPIKANQALSFAELTEVFASNKGQKERTLDKNHGREEERICRALSASHMSEQFFERFKDAKTIFEVTRIRREKDKRFVVQETGEDGKQFYELNDNEFKQTEGATFYVSSRKLDAGEALKEIRKHWHIENNLHWVLDVAFREDDWTVKAKRLARSLSLVRKMALNLIRSSKTTGSVRGRMKKAAWNNDFLEKLLFGDQF